MRRARFQPGSSRRAGTQGWHGGDGKTARKKALAEFEKKAKRLDSSSKIAEQGDRRTGRFWSVKNEEALTSRCAVKPEKERGLTSAELSRKDTQDRLDESTTVPRLFCELSYCLVIPPLKRKQSDD